MKSKCWLRRRKPQQYQFNYNVLILVFVTFSFYSICVWSWIITGSRSEKMRNIDVSSDKFQERSRHYNGFASLPSLYESSSQNTGEIEEYSRRTFLSTIAIGGSSSIMAAVLSPTFSFAEEGKPTTSNSSSSYFEPLNLTRVAVENKINVTLVDTQNKMCMVDDGNLTKVTDTSRQQPWWLSWWKKEKKIQDIPNDQILVASVLAGSFTEAIRTIILHPLSTIKTRIQAEKPQILSSSNETLTVDDLTRNSDEADITTPSPAILSSFWKYAKLGNLYAGLVPTLLVSAPCTGLYFGVRDVIIHDSNMFLDKTSGKLLAAFVADIVRLSIETPANLLSTRRQVLNLDDNKYKIEIISREEEEKSNLNSTSFPSQNMDTSKYYTFDNQTTNEYQKIFDEDKNHSITLNRTVKEDERLNNLRNAVSSQLIRDSWLRLPSLIITDLPYLLSRIALTSWLVQGGINLTEFEIESIAIACVCAALTTPFDVAQTRILLASSSDNSSTNTTTEFLSPYRVFDTMKQVMQEKNGNNEGGISNLFAGWLERTLYLGLGRSWFDPIRIIGYLGIRDAILLKWF